MRHRAIILPCACAGLLLAVPALSQDLLPDGRTVFQRAFFDRFAPQTALDIVRRTPGFVLIEGDEDTRGFANAAGNIVVDGKRPAAKSDTLTAILERIPANRVARIEFGPGDVFGGEFRGQPQVLNLILTQGGGLNGSYAASLQRVHDGRTLPEGQGSILYKTGDHSFNATLAYDNDPARENGEDFVTVLPAGTLIERRDKTNVITFREARASGSWEYSAGGRTYRLNGRLSRDSQPLDQRNFVSRPGQPVRFDTFSQRPSRDVWELGGDATLPMLSGQTKLIGLVTRRHFTGEDIQTVGADLASPSGIRQAVDNKSGETILRATHARTIGRWTLEVGGEGALNRLDSDVALETFAGSAVTPVDLPIDDVTVKETRGEAFVAAGRDLAKGLKANLVLAYELSRLTVSGDAASARTLGFPKPKLSLDWAVNDGLRLQGLIERQIGQLDFFDFVSAAELSNERINGGNADLRPERTWRFQLTAQQRILGDGIAKLELAWDQLTQVQDRVPVDGGFDAPGNLGSGRRRVARLTLDAPLGRFGFTGGRFKLDGRVQDSRVRDLNSLLNRRFSGETPWRVDAELRQDLPRAKMGWGVSYYAEGPSPSFRRNEIEGLYPGADTVNAFAEYRHSKALTVRLDARNLLDRSVERRRTFYADRRLAPTGREVRVRRPSETIVLTVKGAFG